MACSRAKTEDNFTLGNELNELLRAEIKKIGNTKAYKARNDFLKNVQERVKSTQEKIREGITNLDQAETGKSYEGGCQFLLEWYRVNVLLITLSRIIF